MEVTIKAHVHCSVHEPENLSIFNCDMTNYGYIKLAEGSVTVELPSVAERTAEAIKALRLKQEAIQSMAQDRIAEIEEQIREMAQLTYKGECHATNP